MIICLFSVLLVGIATFVEDKTSYLMDYNLTQVRSASRSVEDQLRKVMLITQIIHHYVRLNDKRSISILFDDSVRTLKIRKMLILSVKKDGILKNFASFGDDDRSLIHTLDQLGWDSQRFQNDQILVSKASSGDLALGIYNRYSDGGGTAYLCLLSPSLDLPENSSNYHIYLVDSLGDSLYFSQNSEKVISKPKIAELAKVILNEKLTAGFRRWSDSQEDYLVAYYQLSFRELTVIGLISDKTTFSSIRTWVLRATILGISIILISIGLIILFLRRVTEGLKVMIGIVDKMKLGDYSFRLKSRGAQNDEIGILMTSFNLLAGSIDEMIQKTENRIEKKYQVEASSLVQGWIFPSEGLKLDHICLSGGLLSTMEGGGDCWHYEKVRDYVIMFMGRVEGKGISKLMFMSAVKGALAAFCEASKTMTISAPSFPSLIEQLNLVIREITQGKQSVHCIISMFNIKTGIMELINSGQPDPYILRLNDNRKEKREPVQFISQNLDENPPLGINRGFRPKVSLFQFQPGDLFFWFTSELITAQNPTGEILDSDKLKDLLMRLYTSHGGQAIKIGCELLEGLSTFFGDLTHKPMNNITFVVGNIPMSAQFEQEEES